MSAWSDLLNTKHVDAVLASVKAHPNKWAEAWAKSGGWSGARQESWNAAWNAAQKAAWNVMQNAARNAAWDAARDAARDAAWSAAWNAAWDAARNAAWNAACDAVLTLIAYDDSAHLLNTNPEHVKMLAGIGNEAAVLLYPASLAFSEIKNERQNQMA